MNGLCRSCVWHFLKRDRPSAYLTANSIQATYVGGGIRPVSISSSTTLIHPRKQERCHKTHGSLAELLRARFIRQIFLAETAPGKSYQGRRIRLQRSPEVP